MHATQKFPIAALLTDTHAYENSHTRTHKHTSIEISWNLKSMKQGSQHIIWTNTGLSVDTALSRYEITHKHTHAHNTPKCPVQEFSPKKSA